MANFQTDTGWSWVHWYSWQKQIWNQSIKVKQNKEKSKLQNFETEIQTEISFINTLESSKSNTEPVTEFEDNEAKVDKTI